MTILLELVESGLAGLAAGVIMTLFEIPFWRRWGLEAVAEWQVNTVMVSILIRPFTRKGPGVSMAVMMHLFHAIILGILFLVLLILSGTPFLFPAVVAYGVLYSIVLWIVSPYLTRGLFEKAGGFRITAGGLMTSFLAHVVYGVTLGLLVSVLV